MAAAEILEPFELRFADLLFLSCSSPGVSPPPEAERLESVSDGVMAALGPSGPGLLCVTGVPAVPALCRPLLPLARKLALLDRAERARILKVSPWMFSLVRVESSLPEAHRSHAIGCWSTF